MASANYGQGYGQAPGQSLGTMPGQLQGKAQLMNNMTGFPNDLKNTAISSMGTLVSYLCVVIALVL